MKSIIRLIKNRFGRASIFRLSNDIEKDIQKHGGAFRPYDATESGFVHTILLGLDAPEGKVPAYVEVWAGNRNLGVVFFYADETTGR